MQLTAHEWKTAEKVKATLGIALRAMTSRNYRLYFAGLSFSFVGIWMQYVASAWLVYRLTGSATLLGLLAFGSQLPFLVLEPFAGVVIDRIDRKKLLLVTQFLSLLESLLLAFLVIGGLVRVWHLFAIGVVSGAVSSFDIPARQSFVVDLMEKKDDLPNAIALNATLLNSSRLIGPAIAGLLIEPLGEGTCFLLNSAAYCAILVSLSLIRVPPREPRTTRLSFIREIGEGFSYVSALPPVRDILLLVCLIAMAGMPYAVLMPLFAGKVLHGGPDTFGFMTAAAGFGALTCTVGLAFRRSVLGLGRFIAGSMAVFACAMIAFSFSTTLPFALLFLAPMGFGVTALVSAGNMIVQTIVEDDKRGRVMSLFTMAFVGMGPFGSVLAGKLADSVGTRETLVAGGICCLAGTAVFASRLSLLSDHVRPIYIRLGIIQAATLPKPPEEGA